MVIVRKLIGVTHTLNYKEVNVVEEVKLYKEGKFRFYKLIKVYTFEELNQAVRASKTGVTIKPVIKMLERKN